jgi:aryl-alcohol dehydrogenase-like predicted oxidoreductase
MKIDIPKVRIGGSKCEATVFGLGTWVFGGNQWGGQDDEDCYATLKAAVEAGVTHIDTAQAYTRGRSEELIGYLLPEFRDKVFLATKTGLRLEANVSDIVDQSLERLKTDHVDLMYIHWPKKGADMRPFMEGLEKEREKGRILGVGVSNFSVEQMEQVMEVGTIDAHQFCYNLIWRFPEREVLPFCREHNIAGVTYSSIAQGIMTGKFGTKPEFREGDQRGGTVPFEPDVYPHVYAGVQEMKKIADELERPLVHLAIRWLTVQPGISSVLVGARTPDQFHNNVAAMEGEIPEGVLNRITAISDRIVEHVPDVGNIFRYYP